MSERKLEIELLLAPQSVVRQSCQQVQRLLQLSHPFCPRAPCDRLLACFEQIADRLLLQARFRAMQRQERRLGLRDVAELLLQGRRDPRMDLLPSGSQKSAIGRI